jgi:hypothetical protein
MLERKSAGDFIANRRIDHIIELDEGHDRPCWIWVKNGRATPLRGRSGCWIPESVETMLLDGLMMIVAEGLEDQSLIAQLDDLRFGSNVDLSRSVSPAGFRDGLAGALQDFVVNVVLFQDSTIISQVAKLGAFGIDSTLSMVNSRDHQLITEV